MLETLKNVKMRSMFYFCIFFSLYLKNKILKKIFYYNFLLNYFQATLTLSLYLYRKYLKYKISNFRLKTIPKLKFNCDFLR